ncbi:excinuclease ABC subunit UvrA [Amedibacillus sp. YH-ame10]
MLNMKMIDAYEGNLKHISLELPKHKLIVFTGVSGSGKSTLARDVIYNECQRQYLEAMNFQGIHKPKVETMKCVSPSIIITQNTYHKNPRSSLGTITNIYTDLRMIYEKLGERNCPICDELFDPSQCKEEVVKNGTDFDVFLYCPHCKSRIPAFTRTHFSYNTREGACPSCKGMGTTLSIREDVVIDENKSLEEGAITYWEKRYGEYQIEIFYKALDHFKLPKPTHCPIKEYTIQQKTILLYGVDCKEVVEMFPQSKLPKQVAQGRFEGVVPILMRRVSTKGLSEQMKTYFINDVCPICHGERLAQESGAVLIMNTRLPQLTKLTLEELLDWIQQLTKHLEEDKYLIVEAYIQDIQTKIKRLIRIGLQYLCLDRMAMTLSGGEAQRLKLAASLDSEMTGMLYILDEPTIGLHTKDTQGILQVLKELRDRGNTLLVIEHDIDIIKEADHIVELGPGAGLHGGEIVISGTWDEIMHCEHSSLTQYIKQKPAYTMEPLKAKGYLEIKNAYLHNLKNIDVKIPLGVFTCVTGVSGSGKSSLILQVLASSFQYPTGCDALIGKEAIDEVISIHQNEILRTRRSNIATYTGLYTHIRELYGTSEEAKKKNLQAKDFSFNVKGGRCETCEGLGYVISNMLFFEDIEVQCPSCHGQRFQSQVLSIQLKQKNIIDILTMSVEDALQHFNAHKKIAHILDLLMDVGLGYLTLGQSLTTLSGGEVQRLQLAKELLNKKKKHTLYLIDEPTTGLHPKDIEHFMKVLVRLVKEGNSVIVVEHNLQMITQADWIIDLGKEGGIHGGEIVAQGSVQDLMKCEHSYTGMFMKQWMEDMR